MRSFSLAFLIGVCLLQYFTYLPNLKLPLLLLIPVLVFIVTQLFIPDRFIQFFIKKKLYVRPLFNTLSHSSLIKISLKLAPFWQHSGFLLCAIIIGFNWCLWQAHWILDLPLPNNLNNANSMIDTSSKTTPVLNIRDSVNFENIIDNTKSADTIKAVGTITSIPEQKNHAWRFTFAATQLSNLHYSEFHPLNLRISWYGQPTEHLRVGNLWQLQLTIKAAHSFANPGSFDYGKWLFEQHLRITATVQNSGNNLLLRTQHWRHFIDRVRQLLNERINDDLIGLPVGEMINALSVGMRDQITAAQWQILRNTGTNHLMAIAGLHIGFISGMAYCLCNFLWRRISFLTLLIPAQQCAGLAALCAAFSYSALAGFALPAQRAVLMLSIFLLATLFRRHLIGWQAWSLALISVLLWDPLASFSSSFWLSFGTVALIIYGTSARLNTQDFWWRWGQTQWVISIGLIPLSLLFFQQVSLISFIANSIAIPWVGFIILPMSFLGSLLLLFWPTLGKWFLILAEHLLNYLWLLLQTLAAQPMLQWYRSLDNEIIFFTLLIGVIILLAPRGWPARWLGFCWSLPILFWQPAAPNTEKVTLTFLDAGANTIVVVRTTDHTLLYETHAGPQKYVDINNTVIVPYLRTQGITHIDRVISDTTKSTNNNKMIHADNSTHSNLTYNNCISNNIPIDRIWTWNDIHFVYSTPVTYHSKTGILKISNGQNSIELNDKNDAILEDGTTVYSIVSSYTAKENSTGGSEQNNFSLLLSQQVTSLIDSKQQALLNSLPIFYTTLNCGAIEFIIGNNGSIKPPVCFKKSHQHFWQN